MYLHKVLTPPVPYAGYFPASVEMLLIQYYIPVQSLTSQDNLMCEIGPVLYPYYTSDISNTELFILLAVQTFARLGVFGTGIIEHVYMCV